MLKKIDHLGIAVRNLEEAIETMRKAFGIEPDFQELVADQDVKVAGFRIGENVIEYLAPVSDNSPISKFLEKHQSGIHHIAFRVEDLESVLKKLRDQGFHLIDSHARRGADGKRIAFLHPKSFNGILIELCEGTG